MPIIIQWYKNMSRYNTEPPVILFNLFYISGGSEELWPEPSYILAELFNKSLKEFSRLLQGFTSGPCI